MDPNHPAPRDEEPRETTGGPERVTEIVAGDFLVTAYRRGRGAEAPAGPPGDRGRMPCAAFVTGMGRTREDSHEAHT
ncbi:hypothetical protein, partial [Streptomyces calidiresistens]